MLFRPVLNLYNHLLSCNLGDSRTTKCRLWCPKSRQCNGHQGCLGRGLQDTRASCCNGGANPTGYHCGGEVPGRDDPSDAYGLVDCSGSGIWCGARDGEAVDALGFACKPVKELGGILDLV